MYALVCTSDWLSYLDGKTCNPGMKYTVECSLSLSLPSLSLSLLSLSCLLNYMHNWSLPIPHFRYVQMFTTLSTHKHTHTHTHTHVLWHHTTTVIDAYVLFPIGQQLCEISLDTSDQYLINFNVKVPMFRAATSVAVDIVTDEIYWADQVESKIFKAVRYWKETYLKYQVLNILG